jgi:hypothetical protein
MASAVSITRLHAQGKMDNLSNSTEPQTEPVKLPQCGNSQADVPEPSLLDMQNMFWQQPARRRFGSSGRIAAPPMMNGITPTVVPTGRNSFAALAAQDRFRALAAKHVERGAEPQPQPWMRIQL